MLRMPDGVRRLVFAYDVEGYGKRGTRLAHTTQQRLVDVLSYAFDEARVTPDTYETQEQGDGGITLLSVGGSVSEPWLVTSLIGALDAGLAQVNEDLTAGARIRLRVAFDAGAVWRAANGYSGDSVVSACRLRDAETVKDMLADSAGNLVAVVADHLYRDIRADQKGLAFTEAHVTTKEFAAVAWIHLPGGASSASSPPASQSSPERGVSPRLSDALKTDPGLW